MIKTKQPIRAFFVSSILVSVRRSGKTIASRVKAFTPVRLVMHRRVARTVRNGFRSRRCWWDHHYIGICIRSLQELDKRPTKFVGEVPLISRTKLVAPIVCILHVAHAQGEVETPSRRFYLQVTHFIERNTDRATNAS